MKVQHISLYQLFQMNILSDKDLLEIGKKPLLKGIIVVNETGKVQIMYGDEGWLYKDYNMIK